MEFIMDFDTLAANLAEEDLVVVDCRFSLADKEAGYQGYLLHHIPGAFYMDLEKDLSGPVEKTGGRHPLPPLAPFYEKLGRFGINPRTRVLVYDNEGGAMASRLWFLLQYIGHEKVWILGDSYGSWKEKGYPISSVLPEEEQGQPYPGVPKEEMVVVMEEVKGRIQDPSYVLVDAREPLRYQGKKEPIDKIPGRIPSALNFFWRDLLNREGAWASKEEMQRHFVSLPKSKEIVVYCGSGVTACPNVVALLALGYPRVRLYAGSYSDWISYAENPIEKD